MSQEPPSRGELAFYFALSQVGMEMVAPLGVGIALDHYLGWTPWATIIGFVFGFVGGFTHLLVMLKRHEDQGNTRASGGRK